MIGLDLGQVKKYIISPTLAMLGPRFSSLAAVNLLAGIALVESGNQYIAQLGGGPAIGLWQMEPATHDDCFVNFLNYPSNLIVRNAIISLASSGIVPAAQQMAGNAYYACALARVKLFRAPAPLPTPYDACGMASYHKTYYNTAGGATQVAKSMPLFAQAMAA